VVPYGAFGVSDAVGVVKDIAGYGSTLNKAGRRLETESPASQESLLLT